MRLAWLLAASLAACTGDDKDSDSTPDTDEVSTPTGMATGGTGDTAIASGDTGPHTKTPTGHTGVSDTGSQDTGVVSVRLTDPTLDPDEEYVPQGPLLPTAPQVP